MRGAALPAALLLAVLALTLAFAPRRAPIMAVAAAAVSAILIGSIGPLIPNPEIAFAGCWISLFLIAASIHLRPMRSPAPYVAAGLLAGFWAGAVIAAEGRPGDLARSVPVLVLVVAATLAAARGWGIAVKIVSSWIVAVALFAALLPTSTAMPGYRPDHMD